MMKTIKIFLFLSLVEVAGLSSLAFEHKSGPKIPGVITAGKGFAVVELFTSEGCSSCPPADAVIAKIAREVADKPVYILAYHVDYWDRLGWKDVFSSADYTRRQNTYANWLNLSSIYTPQVVVNGKTEFVGSQEGTLRNEISAGLKENAKAELSLSAIKFNGQTATVQYQTDAPTGNLLVLSLVAKAATTAVKAGENRGRTLPHVQIVSNIQNIPLAAKSGEASLKLPANFSSGNYELIAFIQDSQTGEIGAATRLAF